MLVFRTTGSRRRSEIREAEVPAEYREFAEEKRNELIAQLSEADETISDKFLMEEPISSLDIAQAIRRATIALRFTPVFMGSAIKNTGVQPVLDGVCMYLPDPAEVVNTALNADRPADPPVRVVPAGAAPLISLAFKLEEGRFGQLTYLRVYQGILRKGTIVINARTGKKVKLARLVRMHSNEMEDVDVIGAGEICAIFGVECSSGDTFTDGNTSYTMVSAVATWRAQLRPIDRNVCPGAGHLPGHPTRGAERYELLSSHQPLPEGRPYLPGAR